MLALAGADKPRLIRGDDRLRAIAEPELREHPRDVGLHRVVADDEPGGDLGVRQAARGKGAAAIAVVLGVLATAGGIAGIVADSML
jgi:hypothetical protein